MAIKYKGEVEFHDSTGAAFVLRLGMNEFIKHQKELDSLEGREYQRRFFHLGLIYGAESQKGLTLDDAGELIDDLGFIRSNELINETKFGGNVDKALAREKRLREQALSDAADALIEHIDAQRSGMKDPAVLKALDKLAKGVNVRRPKPEGIANPPQEAILTSA